MHSAILLLTCHLLLLTPCGANYDNHAVAPESECKDAQSPRLPSLLSVKYHLEEANTKLPVEAPNSTDYDLMEEWVEQPVVLNGTLDGASPQEVLSGFGQLLLKVGRLSHRTLVDMHNTFVRFFPGLHFKKSVLVDLAVTTSLTCMWFFVYLKYLYATDRKELSHSWADYQEEAQRFKQQHQQNGHITMDLVIALQNPGKKHSNDLAGDNFSFHSLQGIFPRMSLSDSEDEQWFKKVGDQVSAECPQTSRRRSSHSPGRRGSITSGLPSSMGDVRRSVAPAGKALNKDVLRVNVLQDLCTFLPGIGFDVTTFVSSNGEKIFLGVTLKRSEAIRHYLDRDNITLQIQEGIATRLGIEQPDDAMFSPPKIKYDVRAEERLWQAGVIPTKSAAELYMHTCPGQQGDMSVISGRERFAVIYKEVSQHFSLELARHDGLIQDFFAVHDQFQLSVLRKKWSALTATLVQPVNLLETYFGSSIAFRAAWVGMYCKGLLALVPVAMLYIIVDAILEGWGFRGNLDVLDKPTGELEAKHLLGFSLVVVIWARVLWNLWSREEKFFGTAWEVSNEELSVSNAYFRGSYKASKIDSKVKERQYSSFKALLWRYLSWSVVALMCLLVVAAIYIQKEIVENQVPMTLSLLVTLQINIFEFLFNRLAMVLTDWENHRRRVGHSNSYLLKQAIFQSVNNFYPFIYLIVKQANTTTNCPGGACLAVVRQQLRSALVLLSVSRIMYFGGLYVFVNYRRWQLARNLTKRVQESGGEVPFVEEQSVFMEFDTAEQTWAMLESVISLGHTLLFGAIVREAIPLSLGVFFLSRHSRAFVLTRFSQRPFPASSDGIGAWQVVLGLIMKGGIMTNTFCVVAFGESFRGVPTAARVSGFITIAALLFVAVGIVDVIFAPADKDVKLLEARRRHVKQGVARAGRNFGEQGTPRFTSECSSSRAIQEGLWDLIPPWFALKPTR